MVHLKVELIQVEILESLQLAGDADGHLPAAGVEVGEVEANGAAGILAGPLGKLACHRGCALAGRQKQLGPVAASNRGQHFAQ